MQTGGGAVSQGRVTQDMTLVVSLSLIKGMTVRTYVTCLVKSKAADEQEGEMLTSED